MIIRSNIHETMITESLGDQLMISSNTVQRVILRSMNFYFHCICHKNLICDDSPISFQLVWWTKSWLVWIQDLGSVTTENKESVFEDTLMFRKIRIPAFLRKCCLQRGLQSISRDTEQTLKVTKHMTGQRRLLTVKYHWASCM